MTSDIDAEKDEGREAELYIAQVGLNISQGKFEAGSKEDILLAVEICAAHRIAMPEWLRTAFMDAWKKVALLHEVGSWDDVFGAPVPKSKHLSAMRKRRHAPDVYNEIVRLKESGRAVDDQLFEDVGRKFGLGRTLTKEMYSGMRSWLEPDS